jgi:uncharacterized protein YkwD
MPWALISLLVLVLGTGAAPEKASVKPAASKNVAALPASAVSPSPMYDVEAEQQLLVLANQARALAGAPALTLDQGMTLAARAHADAMAQVRELSHQFSGEPSLTSRLAAVSNLHLDRAGENVAYDSTAADAHERLMLSPPHRENLLDPAYNVAGFGVVEVAGRLYVVEDFGRSLPVESADQTENVILAALHSVRQQAGLPDLARVEQPSLREAVCSMALEDRLATSQMRALAQRYTVINYTNMHPEILPGAAVRILADRRLTSAAIGVCYARTATYAGGVYWVGIVVY